MHLNKRLYSAVGFSDCALLGESAQLRRVQRISLLVELYSAEYFKPFFASEVRPYSADLISKSHSIERHLSVAPNKADVIFLSALFGGLVVAHF